MILTLYTSVPRTILWLIPGGVHHCLEVSGYGGNAPVEVEPFYLSKFPVSNLEFEAFDPAFDRDLAAPEDRHPALGVSWDDAEEYCQWYAEVSRKPMRLPTELEWEYACCGGEEGSPRPTPEEIDAMAWHAENSSQSLLPPLEERRANAFGLYGMLGGVWEWVAAPEPIGSERSASAEGILRGGSWREALASISPSARRRVGRDASPLDVGFRVAKSLR
ncbi:MAG: formylglycine-generating enzyme family protein [Thermoanaerobaculia bacterium]|nr:formylglycine-generating enzyme family protein [Thermoanaerobaculia bacterium]